MKAPLLAPDDLGRPGRRIDYEMGGAAVGDPSQGLMVQPWRARIVGSDVLLSTPPFESESVLFSAPNITEVSLAFDQNMRPMLAYVQNARAKLWWYDPVPAGYTVLEFPVDARSPYLCMDDKRDFATQFGLNDVLLSCIRGSRLCTYQQRDRFTVEETRKQFVGNAVTIRRVGMNAGNRIQWELQGLQNKPLDRAYPGTWTKVTYRIGFTTIDHAMPSGLMLGDKLYAFLVHRSAITPPAGWSLVTSQACTNGTSQTLSVYVKATALPADSLVSTTWTQAGTGPIGVGMLAARVDDGLPTLLQSQSAAVNNTATNAIAVPAMPATQMAGESHVVVAASINTNAAVTTPLAPAGTSLISGSASETRLAFAYQLRDVGQSVSGSFTFDNGTPSANGLAVVGLRFGVTE